MSRGVVIGWRGATAKRPVRQRERSPAEDQSKSCCATLMPPPDEYRDVQKDRSGLHLDADGASIAHDQHVSARLVSEPELENLLAETRRFPAEPEFVAQANATAELYEEAERDYEAFWARLARERLAWDMPFETTLEWEPPFAKWFVGGKLNVAYNCVDRHVESGLGDKVAYHWIGEPGDTRTITYADLQREVSKAANALKELGVKTGDVVAIYMPMIPELPIAMLACARIGAPHTVVFGGFSAEALAGRIEDAQAKLIITADGGWRRGKAADLKAGGRRCGGHLPTIEQVLVARRRRRRSR